MNTDNLKMTVTQESSAMAVTTVTCDTSNMTVTMTCESSDVDDDTVATKFEHLDDDYNASSSCPLKREKQKSDALYASNDNVANDIENSLPPGIRRNESDFKRISRYVCTVCAKVLATKGSLRVHIQQQHKDENVNALCPYKQKRVNVVNSHEIATVKNCPHCAKAFKYKQSLRRHVDVFHVDVFGIKNETEVNSPEFSFTCLTCSKMFSTNRCLRQHMRRRRHGDDSGEVVPKKTRRVCDAETTLTHPCSVCAKVYLSRSTLRTHIRSAHEDVDVNAVCVPMKKSCMKCPVCLYDFDGVINPTMASVISHLNEAHDENLQFEHLAFTSENAFSDWLANVENETPCNFQRKYCRGDDSNFVQYFYCSRSGVSTYRARSPYERRRRLKGQGISRCGRTCPAHVILTSKRDLTFDVKYLAKHFCHSDVYDQLGHIRMTKADRQYIADKLVLNLSFDEILRDVRVDLDGSVQRRHIITRKDINNVARALKLKRSTDEGRKAERNDKVRGKEFERLTARCKGKLGRRKLWVLRNRHAKALSLEVTTWEVAPDREWVVSSEENDVDVFTVTRLDDDACLKVDCEMHCAECAACVHDYRCTCADYVTSFNMCKHVHLVCQRTLALGNLETNDAGAYDNFVEELTQGDERNDLKAFEVSEECVRLTSQVINLIEPIADTTHIAQITDSSSSADFLKSGKRDDHTDINQPSDGIDQKFSSYVDRSSTRFVTLAPSHVEIKPVTSAPLSPFPQCPTTGTSAPQFPDVIFSEGYLVCPSSLLANNRVSENASETVNTENYFERIEELLPVENEGLGIQRKEMECVQDVDTDNMLELGECTVWLQTEIENG